MRLIVTSYQFRLIFGVQTKPFECVRTDNYQSFGGLRIDNYPIIKSLKNFNEIG